MDTRPVTSTTLTTSVIAVPPLARDANLGLSKAANANVIRHLEQGGVTTLLYGGNATLAHVAVSEYAALLKMLADCAGNQTTLIPSVGPTYGLMMDQATILREFSFPTAMLLPSREATTPTGIASGLRRFVDRLGKPAVLYLKHDGMVDVKTVKQMCSDGLISWIKYAIVRDNPEQDPFLSGLIDSIGTSLIVSGMGEKPAIVHLKQFGLAGFTSGSVCIAPKLSMSLLRALHAKDYTTADRIRERFLPLEKLRDTINPVRVLHAAVSLAGIADTGPITPFWSAIEPSDEAAVRSAAQELLRASSES